MRQFEIWLVNLEPTIGAEIRKTRPCVILNNNDIGLLPLKIVAPITEFKAHYKDNPWMLVIQPSQQNRLTNKSVLDLFQLRSLSDERFIRKLGELDTNLKKQLLGILNLIFSP